LNKIKKFLEDNYLIIIIFLSLLFAINTCSNRSAIQNITKINNEKLQSFKDSLNILTNKINNIPTRNQFKIDNEILMYEFLQFEDDIDKGKMSLSELKLKLESMRNKND
jgi:hypothetical protein